MVQLTEDMVRDIYRGVLGREPENDMVVQQHASSGQSLANALRAVIGCEEFLSRFRQHDHVNLLALGLGDGDEELLRRHLAPSGAHPDFVSTFVGTRTRVTLAAGAQGFGGRVYDDIPTRIGDIAAEPVEYVGTIKAVEASDGPFVMAELGAGLGTWSTIGGHIARKAGRGPIRLYAVEASAERVENLKTNFIDNGFDPAHHSIHAAIVGPRDGYALFPQIDVLADWGASALFIERPEPRLGYDMVKSISLQTLLAEEECVDLLHFDVQGAEAEVIGPSIEFLNASARYMIVGTHGREIEHDLLVLLKGAGWRLENEQPALFDRSGVKEQLRADGTQVWRNPRKN